MLSSTMPSEIIRAEAEGRKIPIRKDQSRVVKKQEPLQHAGCFFDPTQAVFPVLSPYTLRSTA
jgi:hypothetical protein